MGNHDIDHPYTKVGVAWAFDIKLNLQALVNVALCQDPWCCMGTLCNTPMVQGDVTHHMGQRCVTFGLTKPHKAAQCCLAWFIDWSTVIGIALRRLVPRRAMQILRWIKHNISTLSLGHSAVQACKVA